MIKRGEVFDLKLNIKGKVIRGKKSGILLGLNWDRDMGWGLLSKWLKITIKR